ncbi:MAG: hypothetical protein Q8R07_01255, partial [Candidatus Uhrbacteria bacterium]|nr:hypothetical protein [Candidatus Uhrbacteria bacterium]
MKTINQENKASKALSLRAKFDGARQSPGATGRLLRRRGLLLAMTLLCCFVFLFASPAHAFSVHPALFDIAIDPGQIHRGMIEVTNDDVVDQTYDLSIQKFLPQGESGQQEFLSLQDISGLPSWM